MVLFKNLWATIKPTVRRFPGALLLNLLYAVFCCLAYNFSQSSASYASDMAERMLTFTKSTGWAWALAVATQLSFENALASVAEKKRTCICFVAQAVCVVLAFFPGYFWCNHSSDRFWLVYIGTLLALLMLSGWLLHATQRMAVVIPNIIMSGMIAGIIAGCIGSGCSIIALAIQHLIYNFEQSVKYVYPDIWISAWTFFFVSIFLSYTTKKSETITIPKAFKVIVLYVLFPLYGILLAVLYVYLIKSLVMRSLPSGMINPFVSTATVLYLLFYLSLQEYKNKVTAFFYRFGSIFLLVLIVAQIVGFVIRINAYGFTATRYASLFYILFSIAFCVLPLIKNGAYMKSVYLLFGVICLLASLSPFNLIDAPIRNQLARIISTMKKYDLYQDGAFVQKDTTDIIARADKAKIVGAYNMLRHASVKKTGTLSLIFDSSKETDDSSDFQTQFQNTFGFAYSTAYDNEDAQEKTSTAYVIKEHKKEDLISWYKTKSDLLNKIKSEIDTLDRQIDQEVYKLYNLTPEEIQIIEGV